MYINQNNNIEIYPLVYGIANQGLCTGQARVLSCRDSFIFKQKVDDYPYIISVAIVLVELSTHARYLYVAGTQKSFFFFLC